MSLNDDPGGRLRPLFFLAGLLLPALSYATTAGVPGSGLRADDQSAQYRLNYRPSEGARPSSFNHRFHYQQSLNANVRLRAIAQYVDGSGRDLELQWSRVEAHWQYRKFDGGGGAAVRLDLQKSDINASPDFARVFFITDRAFGAVHTRFNVLLGRELGDRARSGLTAGARMELSLRSESGMKYGLQFISGLNTTSDYGSFDEQSHQVGPVFERSFGDWNIFASYLTGVSDLAPDDAFRLWINRRIR